MKAAEPIVLDQPNGEAEFAGRAAESGGIFRSRRIFIKRGAIRQCPARVRSPINQRKCLD